MRLPIRPKPITPKFLFEKEFAKKFFRSHSLLITESWAFEQFLLREFMQVHQQISGGQEEIKKRNSKASVNQDGIPLDIEQHLSMALQNILKQDKKNDSQDTN